mmetsp:Transcript_3478/g.5428  ORF Transcript_3478/g.5428 Transcript_3478/m.5428 type:complete len:167 (+) Transcript_3478:49-549(+)
MDDTTSAQNESPLIKDSLPKRNSFQLFIYSIILIFILGICIMHSAVAALCISHAESEKDTGQVFLALYMILMSAILFTFETVQLRPIELFDGYFKRNFGFLYNPASKGCFMFFVGLMAFGLDLDHPKGLDLLSGIVTCGFGIFLAMFYLAQPKFFPPVVKHYDGKI